ncbi:MAG: serine hydrolase [Nocardioidaceae bacterium]
MTSPVRSRPLDDFVQQLPTEGLFSVWCGPCAGPAWLAHQADAQHYAASTMKVALVLAAYRRADAGELDLDRLVTVHDDFASATDAPRFTMDREDDSDPEPWRRIGQQVSLRWLGLRALVRSSNLATNLLLEVVGVEAVQAALVAVGCTGSAVERGIEDAAAREVGLQNLVTAADLARTLQALSAGSTASTASSAEILSMLGAQQLRDMIPAGLPPGTPVAHKSGWVDGISHDAGIIYPPDRDPFVFVMCTSSALSEQEGRELIAAGAAAAWDEVHR